MQIIKDQEIVDDNWLHLEDEAELLLVTLLFH